MSLIVERTTQGEIIREICTRNHIMLRRFYEGSIYRVFSNDELTAQQVFDELGTDGEAYIDFMTAIRDAILAIKPDTQLTPVSNFGTLTKNGDGTVTVTLN